MDYLEQEEAQLTDREAAILLPTLAEKVGHNAAVIRTGLNNVLTRVAALAPLSALQFLCTALHGRNRRSVADVLEVLANSDLSELRRKSVMDIAVRCEDKDVNVRDLAASVLTQCAVEGRCAGIFFTGAAKDIVERAAEEAFQSLFTRTRD